MNVEQALDEIKTRIEAASTRVCLLGEPVDPPCVVLTPPHLAFNGPNPWPTDATFAVACVVLNDDRMVPNLLEMVRLITRVLDESTEDFALSGDVTPGLYPSGGTNLPAYLIEIEAALNDS